MKCEHVYEWWSGKNLEEGNQSTILEYAERDWDKSSDISVRIAGNWVRFKPGTSPV
jgi:hypothetical protein